jgi:predicted dehydrogenase
MNEFNRREFIKTTAMATAGVASGLLASSNFAYANVRATLRVGLIGCGGRGTGAARDCATAADGVEIVAMGDAFEDRLDGSRRQLQEALGAKFKVDPKNCFVGLDAYQKVLACDIDLVILATPPGFRPTHFEAAVNAGKHIFMEKPVATDAAGIRKVLAAAEVSKQKRLAVVAGTQRRHDPAYVDVIKRIQDGALGQIVGGQVYWNQGGLWKYDRKPGMSDMEWQMRNWLYFSWASGDHIVEQHIHNIDVANWAMNAHPVKAIALGGRQMRVDPAYGHIFDHFAVEFEYPNGTKIQSMCRQQDGTEQNVSEFFIGTKGVSDAKTFIRGENAFRRPPHQINPYVQEHADLIASIRANTPLNEATRVAESTLSAILGREAAYTGQLVTWDDLLQADQDFFPKTMAFGELDVAPVPQPGVTKISRPPFGHFHAK